MAHEIHEVIAGALDRLAELHEHLANARQALAHVLAGHGDHAAEEKPPPLRALDAAHAAAAVLDAFTSDLHREVAGGGAIRLDRDGPRVTVLVPDTATAVEVTAFTAELRRLDERLLGSAELLGLLIGLCVQWAAVGFAPPVVLSTLATHAPRILQLAESAAIDFETFDDSTPTTREVTP